MTTIVYSDGGCDPNPGPGGWGVVIAGPNGDVELRGAEPATTNNRMEVTAAIEALAWFDEGAEIEMRCDSKYVVDAMTSWIRSWKRNGWRTASKEPVKNEDLFRRLDALASNRRVKWTWVRGHSGDPRNERADRLVHEARKDLRAGKTRTVAAPPPSQKQPATVSLSVPVDLVQALASAAKERGVDPDALFRDALYAGLDRLNIPAAMPPEDRSLLIDRLVGLGRTLVAKGVEGDMIDGATLDLVYHALTPLRFRWPVPGEIPQDRYDVIDALLLAADANSAIPKAGAVQILDVGVVDRLKAAVLALKPSQGIAA